MVEPGKRRGRGGGGRDTRSGTEKRCSHNLQSRHPAWLSADNSSIFPTVNILIEARSKPTEKIIKILKKINIIHLCFSCIPYLSFGTDTAEETTPQPC